MYNMQEKHTSRKHGHHHRRTTTRRHTSASSLWCGVLIAIGITTGVLAGLYFAVDHVLSPQIQSLMSEKKLLIQQVQELTLELHNVTLLAETRLNRLTRLQQQVQVLQNTTTSATSLRKNMPDAYDKRATLPPAFLSMFLSSSVLIAILLCFIRIRIKTFMQDRENSYAPVHPYKLDPRVESKLNSPL